jgi:hypothetical protein
MGKDETVSVWSDISEGGLRAPRGAAPDEKEEEEAEATVC